MEKMNVEYMDYYDQNGNRIVFGMNVSDDGKQCPIINLFDIDENKENPYLSSNILAITKHILNEVLGGQFKKRSHVNWTMTTGFRTTDIEFDEAPNSTLKVSLSDSKVFDWEQSTAFSLDRYNDEYFKQANGSPIHKEDMGQYVKELVYPKMEKSYDAMPCEMASEGFFYCQPNFESMPDIYEIVLVDAKKLIERISKDDPEMIDHAKRKFQGRSAESCLKGNSPKHPCRTGSLCLTYGEGGDYSKLVMDTGDAGLLIAIQELDLPCIPIAISKQGNLKQLINEIGYDEQASSFKHDLKLKL